MASAEKSLEECAKFYDPNLSELIETIIDDANLLSSSKDDESLVDAIFYKLYIYHYMKLAYDSSWALTYLDGLLKSRENTISQENFMRYGKIHLRKSVESVVQKMKKEKQH